MLDAVVVGAGPNGLAAAITLAAAGRSVRVLEAGATVGGGARSAELTLPGFVHDVCSAIHPMAVNAAFLRGLPLERHGLSWIHSPAAAAHPLDDGRAALLCRSLDETAASLGEDGEAYRRALAPFAHDVPELVDDLLAPLGTPPRHPLRVLRFGWRALRPAALEARRRFRGELARALFAGMAAHAVLPLESAFTASFGYIFCMLAHGAGWPLARGGSQAIADALAAHLRTLGGRIEAGRPVAALRELPEARAVLFDLTPRQLLAIAGDALPAGYRRRLQGFRYGPGSFKVDYALDGPIPWRAADCARAATVHLGGTLPEVAASERAPHAGRLAERPFVLVAQQSLFDPTRAPAGKQVAWAYCHVPHACAEDASERIEAQIERFAPGFRARVLARATHSPAQLEAYNANYVGGDIAGGATSFPQLFFRPVASLHPWATPNPRLFLCSSSTPPGAGVHGLCGHYAARLALRRVLRG